MNSLSFLDDGISVSDFIELVNQTFDLTYPIVKVIGELANFRISKNRWIYFDLKDEYATLKFFGSVYQLRGPLEDGMMLKVTSSPNLHNTYGFSMNVQSIELIGEGSIKRAAELLHIKLAQEGLFDLDKKRPLPYPPTKIGLITSAQSAAYHDFIKIINNRWRGLKVTLFDVQVQGEAAVTQISQAIEYFNANPFDNEVLVLIRGGGSPEDLSAFSSELVTRAVAASKIPTLVGVGHEIDISTAELAADRSASTPSHAAEVLVPDKRVVLSSLKSARRYLNNRANESVATSLDKLKYSGQRLGELSKSRIDSQISNLAYKKELIEAYNPELVLGRGYAIVRKRGKLVRSADSLLVNDSIDIDLAKGSASALVKGVNKV